jgi:hypothetical protein
MHDHARHRRPVDAEIVAARTKILRRRRDELLVKVLLPFIEWIGQLSRLAVVSRLLRFALRGGRHAGRP